MVYLSRGVKETEKLAGFVLTKFLKTRFKKVLVIALEGELGAGKTIFVKGIAKALKIEARIKSPTFTLIKSYKLLRCRQAKRSRQATHLAKATAGRASHKLLYHLDCYRLRDHTDLEPLGIKEILNDPANIVLIEWADRVKKILPKNHIKIHIDHIDEHTRKINVSS